MKRLRDSLKWVTLCYEDNSKVCIYTTLNPAICKQHNVMLFKDSLYDFSREKYFPFDKEVCSVEVTDEKPVLEEVNAFVNQYL